LFRKSEEKAPATAGKDARVGNYVMDPEHRTCVLADEYEGGNNRSRRDPYYRDPGIGVRRRSSAGNHPQRCCSALVPENKKLGKFTSIGRKINVIWKYAGIAPIPTVPIVQDISVPSQTAPVAMASSSAHAHVFEGPKSGRPSTGSFISLLPGVN